MSRDDAAVQDMLNACEMVGAFAAGLDESMFFGDPKTQSAILHQLLVLGEAAKRVSPEYREARPQVPWRVITGMRDKLIHHYDAVDLGEVWRTASRDIPLLAVTLRTPGG